MILDCFYLLAFKTRIKKEHVKYKNRNRHELVCFPKLAGADVVYVVAVTEIDLCISC